MTDIEIGASAPAWSFGPVTRTDIVRYAGASGDFNPIHHDEQFAQTSGFPTVFSMGMFQAGLLASYATEWLGAEDIRRFVVRFREQVWPGDMLEFAGEVISVVAAGPTTRVAASLTCTRQGGGVAITGEAVWELPT